MLAVFLEDLGSVNKIGKEGVKPVRKNKRS